jgi:hypothetical protein
MTHAPRLHRATEPPTRPRWFAAHVGGLIALALGVTGFVVVSLTARELWATPDWRISVPFLIATVAAAVVSLVRRERAIVLPLLGVGFAAAAVVLGWFLLTAIVVGVTTIIILGLSHAM